jgi:hypothetical protein
MYLSDHARLTPDKPARRKVAAWDDEFLASLIAS